MDPADPAKVYLFSDFRGLYRSLDHGDTWAEVGASTLSGIHSFAIAPNDNGNSRLYATTEDVVYASDDDGQSWNAVLSDRPTAERRLIVVDRAEPHKVYVSVARGSLLATSDRGNTWCTVNAEALPSEARDLAMSSTPTRQICAATASSSVLCLDLPKLGGDCDSDGFVRIAELVLAVGIKPGASGAEPVHSCRHQCR